MRRIEQTGQFRRDFKREAKGPHRQTLQVGFTAIITALANDLPLAEKHRDHALTGDWKDHRDCHIKPDVVLIYRKLGDDVLQLVRVGSHSELGL
ncbi:type II toxin-antitoxin system YafQ family toxin (plasmid) [Polaromonas sp. P1-6]|nr:type II toxin-antitoxin system YafQ family toxin [Polaromonas sp. P1-6]